MTFHAHCALPYNIIINHKSAYKEYIRKTLKWHKIGKDAMRSITTFLS